MRIYVIGNDGITLCREPLATVTEGEIAVTSKEELQAAPLSGKRLLALWNALPGVQKRKKLGDRTALIDQLWSAIRSAARPFPTSYSCASASMSSRSTTRRSPATPSACGSPRPRYIPMSKSIGSLPRSLKSGAIAR